MTIWEDTSTDGVWDGDRQYWQGYTLPSDIGPGFVDFCARQGRAITFGEGNNPNYDTYKMQAKYGRHSVFSAGINRVSDSGEVEESWHAMASWGVATFGPAGTGVRDKYIYVYNGWDDDVFLPIYDSHFLGSYGVFFTP